MSNLLLHDYLHIAQDLLDSWLHEKKRDDFNLEVQFNNEKWSQRSKPLERVARNSTTDDYYDDFVDTSDPLLQSHDWTTLSSSHNSKSPNAMGKLFSIDSGIIQCRLRLLFICRLEILLIVDQYELQYELK